MTSLSDLETRIRVLEDIEAIRQLKARYWRYVDNKLWDDLADCFTEDVVLSVPSGTEEEMKLEGKKALLGFLKGVLGESMLTTHQGHQSEIEIISQTTAKGIWVLRDYNVDSKVNTVYDGRGYYEEEYIKENGEWKIKKYRLSYLLHVQIHTMKCSQVLVKRARPQR
jgi:hypothetical protein